MRLKVFPHVRTLAQDLYDFVLRIQVWVPEWIAILHTSRVYEVSIMRWPCINSKALPTYTDDNEMHLV